MEEVLKQALVVVSTVFCLTWHFFHLLLCWLWTPVTCILNVCFFLCGYGFNVKFCSIVIAWLFIRRR